MRILVTGGCGFIGSHLVDRLVKDGHIVDVLDDLSSGFREQLNPLASLTEGDVADGALVAQLAAKADAVFHLAAIASVQVCEEEPEKAGATNVTGMENVLAAANGKPVIYASSAAVYGDNPNLPLSEDALPQPLGNYGKHKLANEQAAAAYAGPSVGLRFFNVYGPRQDARSPYSGVISKFVANARAEKPLTFFGDGEQTRDFIYVGDIVALLVAALAKAQPKLVLNGCTGNKTSLKQLAQAVQAALNTHVTEEYDEPRSGDIRHSLGNPSGAKKALGFVAHTTLAEGLAQLVAADA